jgi:hypothetical protein
MIQLDSFEKRFSMFSFIVFFHDLIVWPRLTTFVIKDFARYSHVSLFTVFLAIFFFLMSPAQKHVQKDRNNASLYLRTTVVPFRISDYTQKMVMTKNMKNYWTQITIQLQKLLLLAQISNHLICKPLLASCWRIRILRVVHQWRHTNFDLALSYQ